MRHIAARAVPRVGQHAVSQELFRRRDSDEAAPPATIESEFAQNLVARAEYRSWRQGDAYASPVPNGGKKLGTDDLLRQLLDGSSPLQALDEDCLTGCLSGYLNGLAPREVQQAPATRLQDEFKLQEVLGVGGFGVVRAATSKLDGRRCAIKAVPLPSRLEREAALGEVRTMAQLPRHPSLVRYMASWVAPGPPPAYVGLCSRAAGHPSSYEEGSTSTASSSGGGGSNDGGGGDELAAKCPPATLFVRMELCAPPPPRPCTRPCSHTPSTRPPTHTPRTPTHQVRGPHPRRDPRARERHAAASRRRRHSRRHRRRRRCRHHARRRNRRRNRAHRCARARGAARALGLDGGGGGRAACDARGRLRPP